MEKHTCKRCGDDITSVDYDCDGLCIDCYSSDIFEIMVDGDEQAYLEAAEAFSARQGK